MKYILSLVAVGLLGTWSASAQTAVSGQAGASAQSQSSMQTNSATSGAQVSGSGSASKSSSVSANSNPGNTAANISDGTKIDATLATSLDAKHSKPGDEVQARTQEDVKQNGNVVLKKERASSDT